MSELLDRIAVVKAKWDMTTLVEALTGETVPANHKIPSPFNEADETPSCHIYDDSFYCYSTGTYGDVVDLVRLLKRCTVERAVQILEEEGDELGLEAIDRVKAVKPAFVMPKTVILHRRGDAWNTPDLPGVSPSTLQTLWAGCRVGTTYDQGLAILHYAPGGSLWSDGGVVGVKYRHGDGKKSSEPGSDFSSFLYQPFQYTASYDTTRCVITEGETDSWAWLSVRAQDHVYSLPSGSTSWKDKFLEQLTGYDQIFTVFDNDPAGKAATDKVTRAIGWGRARQIQVPGLYNDVREAIAAGWIPAVPATQ